MSYERGPVAPVVRQRYPTTERNYIQWQPEDRIYYNRNEEEEQAPEREPKVVGTKIISASVGDRKAERVPLKEPVIYTLEHKSVNSLSAITTVTTAIIIPANYPQLTSSLQWLRLRNDLYCVGWGVKLYSLTHSLTSSLQWPLKQPIPGTTRQLSWSRNWEGGRPSSQETPERPLTCSSSYQWLCKKGNEVLFQNMFTAGCPVAISYFLNLEDLVHTFFCVFRPKNINK